MRRVGGVLATVALMAVLALAAVAPATSASPEGYGYPSSVKSAFVRGCIKGGGSSGACKCVMRKIEREYSYRSFLRIIRRVNKTGDFPSKVDSMITSCAKRYQ